mmetsp:Transcript_46501/g.104528  ORF Transcript_46501/g.104528 Transcript_46501/m.104528 type:complete len:307 (-) Transcript_46501:163-1083(-)
MVIRSPGLLGVVQLALLLSTAEAQDPSCDEPIPVTTEAAEAALDEPADTAQVLLLQTGHRLQAALQPFGQGVAPDHATSSRHAERAAAPRGDLATAAPWPAPCSGGHGCLSGRGDLVIPAPAPQPCESGHGCQRGGGDSPTAVPAPPPCGGGHGCLTGHGDSPTAAPAPSPCGGGHGCMNGPAGVHKEEEISLLGVTTGTHRYGRHTRILILAGILVVVIITGALFAVLVYVDGSAPGTKRCGDLPFSTEEARAAHMLHTKGLVLDPTMDAFESTRGNGRMSQGPGAVAFKPVCKTHHADPLLVSS